MSLRGVRKVVTEFNAGLKFCKFSGGSKPPKHSLDTSKDVLLLNKQLSSLSLCRSQTEKFCCPVSILDVAIKRPIIEPNKIVKINFELPIKNSNNSGLDLPLRIEKDVTEPGTVIIKRAIHEIIIRRRKMRKHKRKKFERKFKTLLGKRRLQRALKKEKLLQASLMKIMSGHEKFNAEKYVLNMLKRAHWKKPVTKVRGRLAPSWVIREHLVKVKDETLLKERIQECLK